MLCIAEIFAVSQDGGGQGRGQTDDTHHKPQNHI